MVTALVRLTLRALREVIGVQAAETDVLELDSTTPAKFSRHLVVRTPGHAFRGPVHVGAFVRHVMTMVRRCMGKGFEALSLSACLDNRLSHLLYRSPHQHSACHTSPPLCRLTTLITPPVAPPFTARGPCIHGVSPHHPHHPSSPSHPPSPRPGPSRCLAPTAPPRPRWTWRSIPATATSGA